MSIRIGTLFTGTVDRVGEQSVQTKFFMIGVPLIPMESYYVLREEVGGVNGFSIPLNSKSVLLAYARWGSFIAAVIAGVMAMATSSYHREAADFLPAIVFASAWLYFTFFTASPSRRERARRSVLRSVTGLAAPPALLPPHIADEVLKKLEAMPAGSSDLALEFATSLYRSVLLSDTGAAERAEAAWAKLENAPGSVVWA